MTLKLKIDEHETFKRFHEFIGNDADAWKFLRNSPKKVVDAFRETSKDVIEYCTGDSAEEFCEIYQEYLPKFQRVEFIRKCRNWRERFGKDWASLYREGFEREFYGFTGNRSSLRVEPRNDSPYEHGRAAGFNKRLSMT